MTTLSDIVEARAEALALVQAVTDFKSIPYFVLRRAERVSCRLDSIACRMISDDRADTAAENGDRGDE